MNTAGFFVFPHDADSRAICGVVCRADISEYSNISHNKCYPHHILV